MVHFSIKKSIEILERTPKVLINMLEGLSVEWTNQNEGPKTWTVFDVVGHLIHGEKTDWLPRTELILSIDYKKKFQPFAQFEVSKGKTLHVLLNEFQSIRRISIEKLNNLNISEDDLIKTGIHPSFGEVSLAQLLATWVVHDLDHIAQIARIMAKQYKDDVGPWVEYLKILRI
jgi:uncharacterized damage-inducible protein DinB